MQIQLKQWYRNRKKTPFHPLSSLRSGQPRRGENALNYFMSESKDPSPDKTPEKKGGYNVCPVDMQPAENSCIKPRDRLAQSLVSVNFFFDPEIFFASPAIDRNALLTNFDRLL